MEVFIGWEDLYNWLARETKEQKNKHLVEGRSSTHLYAEVPCMLRQHSVSHLLRDKFESTNKRYFIAHGVSMTSVNIKSLPLKASSMSYITGRYQPRSLVDAAANRPNSRGPRSLLKEDYQLTFDWTFDPSYADHCFQHLLQQASAN